MEGMSNIEDKGLLEIAGKTHMVKIECKIKFITYLKEVELPYLVKEKMDYVMKKMKGTHCPGESIGLNRIMLGAVFVEKNQKYFWRHESFQVFKDFPSTENKYRNICCVKTIIQDCEI